MTQNQYEFNGQLYQVIDQVNLEDCLVVPGCSDLGGSQDLNQVCLYGQVCEITVLSMGNQEIINIDPGRGLCNSYYQAGFCLESTQELFGSQVTVIDYIGVGQVECLFSVELTCQNQLAAHLCENLGICFLYTVTVNHHKYLLVFLAFDDANDNYQVYSVVADDGRWQITIDFRDPESGQPDCTEAEDCQPTLCQPTASCREYLFYPEAALDVDDEIGTLRVIVPTA